MSSEEDPGISVGEAVDEWSLVTRTLAFLGDFDDDDAVGVLGDVCDKFLNASGEHVIVNSTVTKRSV